MSFLDGLYTITTDLTNTDRNQYNHLRFKVAKHPYETVEYMLTRILAYLHSYEEGLEFTQGLFDPKQPAIWKKDILDEPIYWIEVGNPEKKRLYHASCNNDCRCRIYFYCQEQVDEFCHDCVRGTANSWINKIEFFYIDSNYEDVFEDGLPTRTNWEVTIIDGNVYFIIDGKELATTIQPLDIWSQYQLSIGNI